MLPSKQRKLEATQQTRSAGTAILSGTGHLFMATLTKVIQSAGQQVHDYFQRWEEKEEEERIRNQSRLNSLNA